MSKKLRLDVWNKSFWTEKHPLTKVKKILTGIAGVSATSAVASSQIGIDDWIVLLETATALLTTFGAVGAHLIEVYAKARGWIKPNEDIDGQV